MPYVDNEFREMFDELIQEFCDRIDTLVKENNLEYKIDGLLNYIATEIILNLYMYSHSGNFNYAYLQRIKGLFANMEAEFQDRIVRPYEDLAIEKNGDIESIKLFLKRCGLPTNQD